MIGWGAAVGRPLARTEGVVVERLDDEFVLYDQWTEMAHCLSGDAATVWERCDGELTRAEIARELELAPPVVDQAVEELDRLGLLDGSPVGFHGYSRRQATAKLAKVGAAAFAAPLIYSVVLSEPAWAGTSCYGLSTSHCSAGSGQTGTGDPDCTCASATGCCYHPLGGTGCDVCVPLNCVPNSKKSCDGTVSAGSCTKVSDCCCSYVTSPSCTSTGSCSCSAGACSK